MMSVYVEETLARTMVFAREPTVYDGRVSTPGQGWPLRRIVVVPLVLFVVVSAGVFTLAKLHPASPATATGPVKLGDAAHGRAVYLQKCAPCHGQQAEGKVGPRLAGAALTAEQARAQIDNGGGIMPAKLVTGRAEADVLAYLESIFGSG
jgi:mono/diheme cytochrome c family protein